MNRRNSALAATLFLVAVATGIVLGFFVDQETVKKWRKQILEWLE